MHARWDSNGVKDFPALLKGFFKLGSCNGNTIEEREKKANSFLAEYGLEYLETCPGSL